VIATEYIPAIKNLENTPEGQKQAEALNRQIRQQWSVPVAFGLNSAEQSPTPLVYKTVLET